MKTSEQMQFLLKHICEALGKSVFAKLLFRATRDGNTIARFHELCDGKGPLLVLFVTPKDILCGGFSSISWKSQGGWTKDPKCFIYSLKTMKIYKNQNDKDYLYFKSSYGPSFG
jgi:hypothetical protein